ncbi:hypothetical protein GCM10009609_01250 [Pseudonocardia aurantiaca]|uniref:DUF5134 domain-containing protein n=1 Tax=Pseudonocardia aurantiaca TaxID=75290 RepID=A0ABW4FEX9_9PSEU
MNWGSAALALACLAAAGLHLVRLAVRRRDVVGEASHAAMALGMAAMASPLGDPVPEPVWMAVYVVIAVWFAMLVLRTRSTGGDAVHHVVGSGAMLFMLAADHSTGHMSHGGGPASGLVAVTAMAFTGYFAWHALRCADRCRREQEPCDGHNARGVVLVQRALAVHTPQAGAVGHLVAAVAMSAMLMTMV